MNFFTFFAGMIVFVALQSVAAIWIGLSIGQVVFLAVSAIFLSQLLYLGWIAIMASRKKKEGEDIAGASPKSANPSARVKTQ